MNTTNDAIWAVSDGRAGLRNQVLGLAEAVARLSPRPIEIKTIDLKAPWRALPPTLISGPGFGLPFSLATAASDKFAQPWPRLLIACGRMSLPLSIAARRLSARKTFTVQTQDPRVSPHLFDLVVPPLHDALLGKNVFPIIGSPNRITEDRLSEGRARFEARYAHLPLPRVGVLIGGKAKHLRLTPERMRAIANSLIALTTSGAGLMVTTSRRTGAENVQLLKQLLARHPAEIWDGNGDNPYFGILALADFLLVTEDSVNMTTEAAATGKPVFTLKLDGRDEKFARFHDELRARGITRAFDGKLDAYSYVPLREADRAAVEICHRAKLPILSRRQG